MVTIKLGDVSDLYDTGKNSAVCFLLFLDSLFCNAEIFPVDGEKNDLSQGVGE